MKCPHCQSEWTARGEAASQIKNCPFCGKSLQQSQKTDTLEGCLRQIYGQFGIDPFRSGKALVGLHSDLMPDRQRDRRLLAILLLCEGHTALLDILKKPRSEQSVAVTRLAKKMESDWMIKPEAIREVCSAFWLAVGGDRDVLKNLEEQQSAPAPAAKNTPAAKPEAKKPAAVNNAVPGNSAPAKTYHPAAKPANAVCIPSHFQQRNGVLTKYTGSATCIAVPQGIHTIGNEAFRATSVEEVWLPEGVKVIGEKAFYTCPRLKKIYLPQSLQQIGSNAFYDCKSLSAVEIPPQVSIGDYAFMGCGNLAQVTLYEGVPKIESFAFSFSYAMERFYFPGSAANLKEYMFSNCKKLQYVELGNGVRRIFYNAFSDCSALKTLVIPDTVTAIDDNAFKGCGHIQVIASDHWKNAHPDLLKKIP